MRIVYVTGYGRSGSTMFNVLTANVPGVRGLGEACNLFYNMEHGGRCSCGRQLSECESWAPIGSASHEILQQADEECAKSEHALGWRTWKKRRNLVYLDCWRRFLQASESSAQLLVDTSKTTTTTTLRPLLYRTLGHELEFVHIRKSPEQLLASLIKGSNRAIERGEKVSGTPHLFLLRSFFGAAFAYLAAAILPRLLGVRSQSVAFDELVSRPDAVIRRLGLTAEHVDLDSLDVGHVVGGNRFIRISQKISLERTPVLPSRRAPLVYRLLFSLLGVFGMPGLRNER